VRVPRFIQKTRDELDEHLERFERRFPERMTSVRAFVRWLRKPGSGWIRIPLGIALILCGLVGFLPILGFWMIPLGFLVLAKDVPVVRPPLIKLLDWVERKWPSPKTPTP
jgi:hypothetical protein